MDLLTKYPWTAAAVAAGGVALLLTDLCKLAPKSKSKRKHNLGPPPEVLHIYGADRIDGDPDLSPAVIKVIAFCEMASLPYKVVPYSEHQMKAAPKGKIPYVYGAVLGPEPVGDSELIIDALVAKGIGTSLEDGLAADDVAVATAFRIMLEESVYWGLVYARWSEPEFSRITKDIVLGSVPLPEPFKGLLAAHVQKGVCRQLHAQGVGRHSDDEIVALVTKQLRAFDTFLGGKRYVLGDRRTRFDASAYGFAAAAIHGPWKHPVVDVARGCQNIVDYVDRMRKELFPHLQK